MLSVRNVSLEFDKQAVLRSIDLDIQAGEIICLLGRSGSGKTSLLRVISGLEKQYHGTVELDGQAIDRVPTHERGFGLMFQDFALFPHLNVADNIQFGLKMQHMPANEMRQRVTDILALVGLADYDNRDVAKLSGGEKQRVALARSIVTRPSLLMLDEPLGSLDASLRERLMIDLRDIIKKLNLTAIYVTHDQQEAFAIGDRVAVMRDGMIEQIDMPSVLYHKPKNRFVAEFLGFRNFVRGHNLGMSDQEFVHLHPAGILIDSSGEHEGQILSCLFLGAYTRVVLNVPALDAQLQFDIPIRDELPQTNEQIRFRVLPDFVTPIN